MGSAQGCQVGTWEGLWPWSRHKITAREEVGAGFDTRASALVAAQARAGAEVILQGRDGKFHVHAIDKGSTDPFTRDSVAQVKGYSVSEITTTGENVPDANVVSFATEDNHEIIAPRLHGNPLSGNHYVFNGKIVAPQPAATVPVVLKAVGRLPTELSGTFNSQSASVFLGLTPAQQETFLKLWHKGDWDVRFRLHDMMEPGNGIHRKLGDTDKDGRDVLTGLLHMSESPMATGISAQTVLKETLDALIKPGAHIYQSNRSTCSVTTIEYILATNHPAEFVRLVQGVTSPGGEIAMRGASTLKRVADSVAPDDSGRTNIDRLLQSALMDNGNTFLSYDNTKDTGDFTDLFSGEAGLLPFEAAKVLRRVTGRRYEAETCSLWGEEKVFKRIEAEIDKGHIVQIGLEFKPDKGFHLLPEGHALAITGIEYDGRGRPIRVHLRNPWGGKDDDPQGARGPRRQATDSNGGIVMSYDTFIKRLKGAILPPQG